MRKSASNSVRSMDDLLRFPAKFVRDAVSIAHYPVRRQVTYNGPAFRRNPEISPEAHVLGAWLAIRTGPRGPPDVKQSFVSCHTSVSLSRLRSRSAARYFPDPSASMDQTVDTRLERR